MTFAHQENVVRQVLQAVDCLRSLHVTNIPGNAETTLLNYSHLQYFSSYTTTSYRYARFSTYFFLFKCV